MKMRDFTKGLRSGTTLGVLARLRKDNSGNALAMMAAGMFPLIGLVGGGIDLGRTYATRARLQQACDSSVLAGRKAMVGTVFSTADQTLSTEFFRANFPTGKYGTTTSTIFYTASSDGTLAAIARATVPMSLMRVFGMNNILVAARCTAQMNLANTDVMFVLDTTGSMDLTNPGDTASRMTTMRASVRNFYDQLQAGATAGTRIRYGFVPYSQTVNVGALLRPEWIADQWSYQSRKPAGTQVVTDPGGIYMNYTYEDWAYPGAPWPTPTITNLPIESCTAPSDTRTNTSDVLWSTSAPYAGPPAGTKTSQRYRQAFSGLTYSLDQSATYCRLSTYNWNGYIQEFTLVGTPTTAAPSSYTKYLWDYDQINVDTSTLTVGGSIQHQSGYQHSFRTITWNGCIEERGTSKQSSYWPVPNNAYDMQIDTVPTTNVKTQWGPWLPELIWSRQSIGNWDRNNYTTEYDTQNYSSYWNGALAACPSPAKKLAEMTQGEVDAYLASLVPAGNTYHDIGIIWGARLLSPTGLFASENSTAPNGGTISRHIIFMTDGETQTQINDYDAYGVNALDRRRATSLATIPTKAETDAEVDLRFLAACEQAKSKGLTVWVIAFGTSLTSKLTSCASGGKAFQANNSVQLNAAFASIAADIAKLRLTD